MNLAIVIPCYNEEEVLSYTHEKMTQLLKSLIDKNLISSHSKIYFVDDGSRDKTWEIIENFSNHSPFVSGIKLSRNCGHQNALMAGIFSVDFDVCITIDADLQDDINVIEEMVKKYHEGYNIVYGVRKKRDSDTKFKKLSAEFFYTLMQKMGVDVIHNHADFRLMDKKSVEALKEFKEVNLFLRGMIPLIGYKSCLVYYDRIERFAGESKYPLKKMLNFAWDGVTSFSVLPLRFITILGFLIFLLSCIMGVWAIAIKLFTNDAIAGWASTVIPIYFIGGIQLFALGIIGEYIGKIYKETKQRPRYFVEKIV
ncbi:MAG: glycosyltransferase family 2 protein [Campylobacterales bacterium]|nr:glycosyltransferase family 2 protein [Campylobacterales bacterium]